MRITFILPTANLSGGIKVVSIYATLLAAQGHQVTLISHPPQPILFRRKLKSFFLGKGWPPNRSQQISQLDGLGLDHRVIDRYRPITDRDVPDADVVIATWWETAEWVNALHAKKGAKVYFVQGHEIFDYLPVKRCEATYRLPLHKIVIARWLRDLMRDKYGDACVDIVPNSVDHNQFHAPPRSKQPRPTVGFLYHEIPFKGLDTILSALARLRASFPALRAICFGSKRTSAISLPEWIEFTYDPPQERIRDIYAQCDVWVTASRSEGFNLPAMEAMACRTPVVSTRTGWPEESIQSGLNGYLVEIGDVMGLVDATKRILSLSEAAWREMSARAWETVAQSTWQNSARMFVRALDHARLRARQAPIVAGVPRDIPNNMLQGVQQPVFLVGAERSGTTLLRLMLDHHPEIAFNLESEYMVTQISDDGVYPEIGAYRKWLIQNRVFKHSHFTINETLGFVELLNDFLLQKKNRDAKQFVGATVHYQFSKLHWVWPRAKFIYLFRDGRDVARSVVQMGWAGNTYVAADWWLNAEREWDLLRRQLSPDQWIEIRHEDLICDTRNVLLKVCEFVGTNYDERMFDYVHHSAYGLPDRSLSHQWRKNMSSHDLRLVEQKIGERLAQRGYPLSGLPPLSVSVTRDKYICLQSRWVTFLRRCKKFGLRLVLQEFTSRQLRIGGWHQAVTGQIDQAIDRSLR